MANYRDVMHETETVFYQVKNNTSIPNWVNFKLLTNERQKEIYQIKKSSDLITQLTNGIDIIVIINESIFDELDTEQKLLILEEALSGVYVDEKEKIHVEKFNFSTYTGFLNKYGNERVIRLKESIISLYDKKKQEDEEMKINS